ncbi:MAG: isoprenylcysteine carboxylmethyltransferase family protein [Hyphomonadaceae bacterium]
MAPQLTVPPNVAITYAWVGFFATWLAAAVWSRRTAARAGISEIPSRLITVAGALLLFTPTHDFSIGPEWDVSDQFIWLMFAIVVAGLAFAWWARLYLGPLWSGSVTRKADHRIVETGPYALVRHPIYTGMLTAGWATALSRAETGAVIGAILVCLGIWMKARLEERFLSVELGPEYAAYRERVPMLVPFLRF